ncbi:MAG: heat-inducible transcription repressor HrcA [Nitriliruptorales bacterium]|nr:heat-inducible transcription repressor HrcA [Nitriliruptorales bacterium]
MAWHSAGTRARSFQGGDMAPALDERRAAILNAIVQDYVRGGEPVGSKRLVEEWNLGVSPATVRSDMAALEEAGLITHPHTSAGRIPTDAGYRHFVDGLTATEPLRSEQAAALENLLMGSPDLEELLRRTSSVLSRLTRFAALVVAPRLDRSRLRHIELVHLAPTSVLAVLIVDTGRVEKRMLELDAPVAEHDVQRARHAINDAAANLPVAQAPDVVAGVAAGAPAEVRPLIEAVAAAVRKGLASAMAGDQLFVGGSANMAGGGYFERLEQVKSVFETLEEQVVVLQVLREALEDDPAVRIGTELPLVELAACSVVAARYSATGGSGGTVGVLGPTRMDYPRTLAAVQAVASSLEKALAELTGAS